MHKKRLLILAAILLLLTGITAYFKTAPPSPLYFLKISRESIQTFFIFGDEDKANWLLTRAEKRITEAEFLKSKNLQILSGMQITTADQYQNEASKILDFLSDKTNTNYLQDRYKQNSDRLSKLQ